MAVLSMFFGGRLAAQETEDLQKCIRYQEALVKAIGKADKIEVIEHSDPSDFPSYKDPKTGKEVPFPYVAYRTVTMDAEGKEKFLQAVQGMQPTVKTLVMRCYKPHHTLRFHEGGKLAGTMVICLQCHRVDWDQQAAGMAQPDRLIPLLARQIRAAGMDPGRDMEKAAEQWHAKQGGRKK